MDKKNKFKEFVKKNPSLLKYVNEEKMTWQKFHEMYDIYGEDNSVWDEYIKKEEIKEVSTGIGIADVLGWLKNVNLDKMQESINSVQRVLGVLEDLGSNNKETKPEYKPRPLYKHFED